MRRSLSLLSPPTLIAVCWTITVAVSALTLALPDQFDLVTTMLAREGIDQFRVTLIGVLWLMLAITLYGMSDAACRTTLTREYKDRVALDHNRAAQVCWWTNLVFLSVTGLWIVLTAARVGGAVNLAAIIFADSLSARDLLLENKLFTGMRLFYAALPATGAFAAILLAAGGDESLDRRNRLRCRILVAVNLIALLLLPIVMSQRLLLLQFLLAAFIGRCMVRGRIASLWFIPAGVGLFLATWIMREAVTNVSFDRSAVDVAFQKLAFYFVNDLWNSLEPLSRDIHHTFGMFSLKGLLFLTFTDGYFANALSDNLREIEVVRGGGEFSIFTAPFVDFGPLGGAVFIVVAAFTFRQIYHRARNSLIWAVAYGQLGATLLFSTHSVYFTHQNFLFSMIVIAVIWQFSRPTTQQSGLIHG